MEGSLPEATIQQNESDTSADKLVLVLSQDQYEIDFSWLSLEGILGEGAFGKVIKGQMKEAPRALKNCIELPMVVAVKMTKGIK